MHIGKPQREIEVLPTTVPISVPEPIMVPSRGEALAATYTLGHS